ncbi:MAG: hypothetical protein Sapg2KO_26590 [Saprospiraceae bacterium]
MPHQGQKIVDKFSGDTIEFLETAADTNGERITIKWTLVSKGQTVDDHIHLLQNETFKVTAGRLTCIQNGEIVHVNAGEEIVLPKNTPHNHYNEDDQPAEYIQVIEPAYDLDYFAENLFGMINDGIVKEGKMPFFQAMITGQYLDSKTFLAAIPLKLQQTLAAILGPILRVFGYRALYKKYTDIEK